MHWPSFVTKTKQVIKIEWHAFHSLFANFLFRFSTLLFLSLLLSISSAANKKTSENSFIHFSFCLICYKYISLRFGKIDQCIECVRIDTNESSFRYSLVGQRLIVIDPLMILVSNEFPFYRFCQMHWRCTEIQRNSIHFVRFNDFCHFNCFECLPV